MTDPYRREPGSQNPAPSHPENPVQEIAKETLIFYGIICVAIAGYLLYSYLRNQRISPSVLPAQPQPGAAPIGGGVALAPPPASAVEIPAIATE